MENDIRLRHTIRLKNGKIMEFPVVDKSSWFYKDCKRQRKNKAKICQVCPFRKGIELQEKKQDQQ